MDGAVAFCQFNGVFFCAADNHEAARAVVTEIARSQFAHFAGANEQNAGVVEVGEKLARQVDRDMADRGGIAADARLAARPFAGHQSGTEEGRGDRAGETPTLRHL